MRFDAKNFSFQDYDTKAPGAIDRLRGIKSELNTVGRGVMKDCRKELREAGATMSTAFSALSIKVLAMLVKDFDLNPNALKIYGTCGVDSRTLGTWNDHRDRKKGLVPTVGNYSFSMPFQVSQQLAVEGSLTTIAGIIKTETHRIRNDAAYRATKNFYCGCPVLLHIFWNLQCRPSRTVVKRLFGFPKFEL